MVDTHMAHLSNQLMLGAALVYVVAMFAYAADIAFSRRPVAAEADYPDPFPAAIWRGNVFATQFHPEKSQEVGKTLLRNFAAL